MDDLLNVIEKNPKIQIDIREILDQNIKLPLNYQSKIGYDTLIQNFILEEIINLMGITIVDIHIELKMKISRIEFLESRLL